MGLRQTFRPFKLDSPPKRHFLQVKRGGRGGGQLWKCPERPRSERCGPDLASVCVCLSVLFCQACIVQSMLPFYILQHTSDEAIHRRLNTKQHFEEQICFKNIAPCTRHIYHVLCTLHIQFSVPCPLYTIYYIEHIYQIHALYVSGTVPSSSWGRGSSATHSPSMGLCSSGQ